jgi:plasmid stabilization system protein ParE
MNYRVALTARAEQDRDAAFEWYVENYSSEFAARWYDGIVATIRSLSQHPLRCGLAHESDRFPFDVREILFGAKRHKHRVLITIHDDLVLVLHIRHSAQRDLTVDDL